ncbi:amidase [Oceanibacterium hippocampi]|uniref:Acylamidase n=1 Tax=Oceanibacterium hippocampi TaxID=745714 RepID=A0A1Y5TJC0_9PROT|nr:amidase [Oceanibacterium hippocampi]SLN65480.1 Acylamidase [Oceanibacterium hippocampi]
MTLPGDRQSLATMPVSDLVRCYRSGDASPVEAAKEVVARIDGLNDRLNAYCHLDPDTTMREAAASEARWRRGTPLSPVDGVPYGVKDMVGVRGIPTRFGSVALAADTPVAEDAPAVARLREAGAVFLGKTTTSEFGWKGTADSPLTGITRNPWNPALTSGGSSGGAACAAATGMGHFQIGTDGGGSLRIPASFCGVVGMKATFGRVPAWPSGPMFTLSNVGPIARTVDDLGLMLDTIARPDPRDWNAVPETVASRPPVTELSGLRVAFVPDEARCDPDVSLVMRDVIGRLADAGAELTELVLPLEEARRILDPHWQAGTCWLARTIPAERHDLLDEGFRKVAERGEGLSLMAYYEAMMSRQKLGESLQRQLETYDVLLTPCLPILPFAAGRLGPGARAEEDWLDWNPYTFLFNLTRQPALSLPAGTSASGLPIGIQLVARMYEDRRLLMIASLVERLVGFPANVAGDRSASEKSLDR